MSKATPAHRLQNLRQRGLTMIEFGVVVTLAAVIIGGVMLGFQRYQRQIEVRDNSTQVIDIIASLQARYGKGNRYPAVTTEVAVKSGVIAESLRDGADAARNSYGGAITVTPTPAAACNGSANGCVTLVWSSVPNTQCSDLVSSVNAAVRAIAVGGTSVKDLDGAIDDAGVADNCDDPASTSKDLSFVIGRG